MTNAACSDLLSVDPGAYAHCEEWLPEDVTKTDLDTGIAYTSYIAPRQPVVERVGAGDQVVSPQEYYQWVLKDISTAISENPAQKMEMARSLHEHTGVQIPFLFTDYDPATPDDAEVYKDVTDKISTIKQNIGISEDSTLYKSALVAEIRFFVDKELEVRSEEGITFNAFQTVKEQRGNCQGLTNLYYGLFILAGLDARVMSVEWTALGEPLNHNRVSVDFDGDPDTPEYIVDHALPFFGKSPKKEISTERSLLDFVALTYTNQSRQFPDLTVEEKREMIETALKLSPHNVSVLAAAIQFHQSQGEQEMAEDLFVRARAVYPPLTMEGVGQ